MVVLGAGSAGLAAFDVVVQAGRSALLVEGGPLGTMCARVGCMPSKAVLLAGHRMAAARSVLQADVGREHADRLWREARGLRDHLVDGLVDGTHAKTGDRLVRGMARFVDANTIDVAGRRLRARAFVVATGSRPVVPDAFAVLGDRILTTDTLFELDALPARVGVVGLGAIGLEMSLALARLGVDVVAADPSSTIGGIADPVVAERAYAVLSREVPMTLGGDVSATATADGIAFRSDAGVRIVDRVLVATGRAPAVAGLDLARAGVSFDADGHVECDEATLRCGRSGVFLAGDVVADRPFQHEAVDEGRFAAQGALALLAGSEPVAPRRRTPLSIVYSDPDIAQVGRRLDDLDPGSIVVGCADGTTNGRSSVLDATSNLLRIYVDREDGTLQGAAVFAVTGEHLAHQLALAIHAKTPVDALLEAPYYHPSVEEMIQTALKDAWKAITSARR